MIRRFWSNKDYDAVLKYPNQRNISSLTLLVRVNLRQINPEDPRVAVGTFKPADFQDGTPRREYTYQRWTPAEWESFTIGFKREVEDILNWPSMGLWLQPSSLGLPDSRDELAQFMSRRPLSPRFRPTVQCGLSVTLMPTIGNHTHVTYKVLRLQEGEPEFREYTDNTRNLQDGGVLTNRSLMPWPPRFGHRPHSAVAHEIGHVLNLDHIDAHNPKCIHGNELPCVGFGTPLQGNLMGMGNFVTTANAMPWLRAIYRLTSWTTWNATTTIPREVWHS